jgi:hypothetical protein
MLTGVNFIYVDQEKKDITYINKKGKEQTSTIKVKYVYIFTNVGFITPEPAIQRNYKGGEGGKRKLQSQPQSQPQSQTMVQKSEVDDKRQRTSFVMQNPDDKSPISENKLPPYVKVMPHDLTPYPPLSGTKPALRGVREWQASQPKSQNVAQPQPQPHEVALPQFRNVPLPPFPPPPPVREPVQPDLQEQQVEMEDGIQNEVISPPPSKSQLQQIQQVEMEDGIQNEVVSPPPSKSPLQQIQQVEMEDVPQSFKQLSSLKSTQNRATGEGEGEEADKDQEDNKYIKENLKMIKDMNDDVSNILDNIFELKIYRTDRLVNNHPLRSLYILISSVFIENASSKLQSKTDIENSEKTTDGVYLSRLLELYYYLVYDKEIRDLLKNDNASKEIGLVTAMILIGVLYNKELMRYITGNQLGYITGNQLGSAEVMGYFMDTSRYLSNYFDNLIIKYKLPEGEIYDDDFPNNLLRRYAPIVKKILSILAYGQVYYGGQEIFCVSNIDNSYELTYKIKEIMEKMKKDLPMLEHPSQKVVSEMAVASGLGMGMRRPRVSKSKRKMKKQINLKKTRSNRVSRKRHTKKKRANKYKRTMKKKRNLKKTRSNRSSRKRYTRKR